MYRQIFFDHVRRDVFGGSLSSKQVEGLVRLIEEADRQKLNNEFLAYCLATATWETARTMTPIHERGARSYFNKYEPGTRIGKVLGNTQPGDGYRFRGRGDVQLTGRTNYERAGRLLGIDLVRKPDRALEPAVSAKIMFLGMQQGWFTGKSLSSYLDGVDEKDQEDLREFVNARRIINGTDKAHAIAGMALAYEKALRASRRGEKGSPVPKAPEAPKATPRPPVAPQRPSIWLRIARILLYIIRGGNR